MKKTTLSFVLFSIWCSAAFGATTFERVLIAGSNVKAGSIAGAGIATSPDVSSGPLTDSKGTAIEWRVKRDEVDELEMRHVFYRQFLVTPSGEALIAGTEVGLHYGKDGKLRSASGDQVTSLSLANELRIPSSEASQRVLSLVRRTPPSQIKAEKLLALSEPELIVLTKDGVSRLAWEIILEDGASLPYRVAVDASTEEILRVSPEFAAGNCEPTTPLSIESAVGVPLRAGEVPNRSLTANYTGGRPAPGSILTHEAYAAAAWNLPPVLAFQQTEDPPWMCITGTQISYTLFPLRESGGSPRFDDFSDVWRGQEAGDAMHHTNLTMEAFRSLGRNGWDGFGAAANVMVHATWLGFDDSAYFLNVGTAASPQGAGITRRAGITYGLEAALDVIAHEWGPWRCLCVARDHL